MWWRFIPATVVRREYGFSSQTTTDWANYCREVAIEIMLGEEKAKLGGEGVTVEIDESKFGRSKIITRLV